MHRPHALFLLALTAGLVSACADANPASTSSACAAAAAKVASCFPGESAPTTCDEGSAAAIAASSCGALQASDTKSDSSTACIWMPWLCLGGTTPPEPAASALTVVVNHCWGGAFGEDTCEGISSLACADVALVDGRGKIVARAYSGDGGLATFDDVDPGSYTVRVYDRAGKVAKQVVGDFATSVEPAELDVEVGDAPARYDISLTMSSQTSVPACSFVGVDLTVTNEDGDQVDPDEVEWSWIVRYERPNGDIDLSRAFRYGAEAATPEEAINRFAFHQMYAGEHVIELIRVKIPSYERKNNPDYERLLDRYRVEDLDAEAISLTIAKKDLPEDLEFETSIIDPLAP